jgi:hypothetical protein
MCGSSAAHIIQEEQARALRGGRWGIVLCTRQWGKSTVMSAKAVHPAYSRPNSLVLPGFLAEERETEGAALQDFEPLDL